MCEGLPQHSIARGPCYFAVYKYISKYYITDIYTGHCSPIERIQPRWQLDLITT
jgi:hypothetical protein